MARQDITWQGQARQAKPRQCNQDKARHGKTRLVMASHCKTRHNMERPGNPSQDKAMQERQGKAWQANAWKDKKDKARHGKERQGKGTQGMARKGKNPNLIF
jgi:hypothetical protein